MFAIRSIYILFAFAEEEGPNVPHRRNFSFAFFMAPAARTCSMRANESCIVDGPKGLSVCLMGTPPAVLYGVVYNSLFYCICVYEGGEDFVMLNTER